MRDRGKYYEHPDKQCREATCPNYAETGLLYEGFCRQHKPAMFDKRRGFSNYYKPRPSNWEAIRKRLIRVAVSSGQACEWCGKKLLAGQDFDLDHRDTERTTTIHDEDNLRVLHRDCHAKRTLAQSIETKQQQRIAHETATDHARNTSERLRANRRARRHGSTHPTP